MFDNVRSIDSLVDELKSRDMTIYHMCQLIDFKAYLKLGGVPSRAMMEDAKLPFTKFDTDDQDKINKVWEMIFFNLQDLGRLFHKSAWLVPPPYGPVQLSFDPEVLKVFADVAICFRSAGANGFVRSNESISTAELKSIFSFEADSSNKRHIRKREEIANLDWAKERDLSIDGFPEVSCRMSPGQSHVARFIPYLRRIIVDPISIDGESLDTHVIEEVRKAGLVIPITNRQSEKILLFNELVKLASNQESELLKVVNSSKTSAELKEVLLKWHRMGITYQYSRYIRYTFSGTVNEMHPNKIRKV